MDAMTTGFKGGDVGSYEASIHLEGALPSLYSTAVISFLEMLKHYKLTEKGKVSRREARKEVSRNMPRLLESLGLPSWILDVRNEAAHFSKPLSLVLMRRVSSMALAFLRDNFWKILLTENQSEQKADHLIESIFNSDEESPTKIKGPLLHFLSLDEVTNLTFLVKSLLERTKFKETADVAPDISCLDKNSQVKGAFIIDILSYRHHLPNVCHNMISFFDFDNDQLRRSSMSWFQEILMGITSDGAFLSDYVYEKPDRIEANVSRRILWVQVLTHLAMKPSKTTVHLLKYFETLLPSAIQVVQKTIFAMKVLLGDNELGINDQGDEYIKMRQGSKKRKGKSQSNLQTKKAHV
jgi:hypothetical protein